MATAGTGLGLAIVKHIVNRHRGGLTVESAPGDGSMFSAYFPMTTERRAQTAVASRATPLQNCHGTVLIR